MKLQKLIDQYLAHQKSLGACTRPDGGYLGTFGRFMGARANVTDVRIKNVEAFLIGSGHITQTWHTKHSILRSFYRYAVSRGYVTVAPLPMVIPRKPPAFIPYVYSHDELARLLQTAELHRNPQTSVDPVTMRTILLLLYGAGLRVSEAINLDHHDVDLKESLLTIRQTKFYKSRLVPFGPDLGRALAQYVRRNYPRSKPGPFFTTRKGDRVKKDTLQHNFRLVCDRAGIRRDDGARFQPRLHDLRHSFAVHRMTSWYRQGADVQKLLPQLSTYLGHVRLKDTQIYLKMTPELLQEASQRFECYAGKEERQ